MLDRVFRHADPSEEYRTQIRAALTAEDWHEAYAWTKGWVGQGGGAWLPESWLAYAASALLHGQPRIAVRSIDLGLGNWVAADADRSILLWARGSIVMRRLADPKSAVSDLESAVSEAPDWLASRASEDAATCRELAAVSRKRKPSVEPAPSLGSSMTAHDKVPPASGTHKPGSRPGLWDELLPLLAPE